MKLKNFIFTAAAALASFAFNAAHASPQIVTFNISPDPHAWFQPFGSGSPFGLTSQPSLSGSITVNGVGTDVSAFDGIDYSTGSKTWALADITSSIYSNQDYVTYGAGGAVTDFSVYLGSVNFSYVFANNTAALSDGTNEIACNGCVSITSSVAAVPEPATWAMMLVGLGGLGIALRSRRQQAVLAA